MIRCSVCGGLNDPNNAVCEHCGSDLIAETESMDLFHENSFKHLDYLIHSGQKEIVLDSDIVFSDDQRTIFENGIKLDVDNLVIDGNGHTVDACGKTRFFYCTGKNITIKNITLKNGSARHGGAIHIKEGELNIEKSLLNENNSWDDGGAIHNNHGRLIITQSEINNNNSRFGGAIYNEEGEIIINKSKLNNNNARSSGGVIYTRSGDYFRLFSKNEGEITINESELNNNVAEDWGGAIYQNGGKITIKKSTLVENSAKEYDGGALSIHDKGKLTIIESILKENTAQGKYSAGGAIDMRMSEYEHNRYLTIVESKLTKNISVKGGAIYIDSGKVNITDSTLSENTAAAGGAIYNHDCERLHIENCKLENNKPDIIYKSK